MAAGCARLFTPQCSRTSCELLAPCCRVWCCIRCRSYGFWGVLRWQQIQVRIPLFCSSSGHQGAGCVVLLCRACGGSIQGLPWHCSCRSQTGTPRVIPLPDQRSDCPIGPGGVVWWEGGARGWAGGKTVSSTQGRCQHQVVKRGNSGASCVWCMLQYGVEGLLCVRKTTGGCNQDSDSNYELLQLLPRTPTICFLQRLTKLQPHVAVVA